MIESKTTDGLKVIREIPDISPCMLEGENGVGKTVAIQLLELISGEIPEIFRRRPGLWLSMKERLGATSVSLENLKENRSLSVTFSPEHWPNVPSEKVGEWLGTAILDDEPSAIEECSELLAVTRIAGDEDLEDTLRRRVNILTAHFRSASELVRQRGAEIERFLDDLVGDFQRANPDDISRDTAALELAERQLTSAKEVSQVADHRLRNLLRALETKRHLEAAGQAATALVARRDELVTRVTELESELAVKEAEAERAEDSYSGGGEAQRRLANAEKLLRNRRSRLANLQRTTRRIASSLSIGDSTADVRTALVESKAHLVELSNRYRLLDSTSVVRSLIEQIVLPLTSAEQEAGDQTLVKTTEGGLTVSETLSGVSLRRQELADQPQPGLLRQVGAEIETELQKQAELKDLLDKMQQMLATEGRVVLAEQEAALAAQQAEEVSEAAQLLRRTQQAVGVVQEALTTAHSELALVQQQIGGMGAVSKEDAEADLLAALNDLALAADQLDDAEESARRAVDQADGVVSELTTSINAIRRSLNTRKAEVDLLIDQVLHSQRYDWLIQSSPDLVEKLAATESRYRTFGHIRTATLRASESAYKSAEFLESLVGIAETFFTSSKPKPNESRDLVQDLRPAFEEVVGQRLRETLNRPSIRKALFDRAEVVRVEAGTRQLTLRGASGDESHRPMEGFSSGERVFAFTQARIADLEPPDKPNRLLVLDEFGAYVAADRLPDLASFLTTEIRDIADQVVVILPLHVDYRAELDNTVGELRSRYEDRIGQIEQRGYCAVTLT